MSRIEEKVVLDVRNLSVALPEGSDRRYAVKCLDLQLRENEILCLVGESGSGKTLTALAIMGLLPVPRVYSSGGEILLHGEDLLQATPQRLRGIRGNKISMIFQEAMSALNPLMTIGEQIGEAVCIHTSTPRKERRLRILELLDDVKLPDPESIISAYPHQLSGGERQRAMIAMALILNPLVLIADEPTTALDVTTEARILELIKEVQRKYNTAVLFISHDFGVVAEVANRIAVMKEGKLIEFGESDQVMISPQHPYTKSLIGAVPGLERKKCTVSRDSKIVLATKDLSKRFQSGGGILGGGRTIH
ncbi:MAG TPA: ABC transporter ATP-binding protein, partial [Desulfosporosinus sp.]|nr:ABC transporter ATP-binding protein [Desulfosporosinus sp.]